MYKSFTAADYRAHWKLRPDYTVDGFVVFGTAFQPGPYGQLDEALTRMHLEASYDEVSDNPYFSPILEFTVNDKKYWFAIAYGGTMLSEWTHLACLFGSKHNIVIGTCGGLFAEADTPQIIVPTFVYADESATRMYEPTNENQHNSDEDLNQRLIRHLEKAHKVWHGPTITCQGRLGETWEDVQKWANNGYYGVEMEAATVFAVSNYFKRSSSALLVIGDNLVQSKTVLDVNYEAGGIARQRVRQDMLEAALLEMLRS